MSRDLQSIMQAPILRKAITTMDLQRLWVPVWNPDMYTDSGIGIKTPTESISSEAIVASY